MTDEEATESCVVMLLMPHAQRTAVLVADHDRSSEAARWRLPRVRVDGAEPTLPEILDAVVDVDLSAAVVLRLVAISAGTDTMLMLEFDSVDLDPPEDWQWQDVNADSLALLEPEGSGAVAAWAAERTEGPSPLRPPWSRPGWLARASEWMIARMEEDGRPAIDDPRQHQLWGISAVVRGQSAEGRVFLKCSAGLFQREAVVTAALAARMPGAVPEVIAVDPAEAWLLMRDLGGVELGDQNESRWPAGLAALADIQRSWTGRTDELAALDVPVRSLSDLALAVEAMAVDPALLSRLSAEVRERWTAAVPVLAESCRRLDRIGPDPTLVHGDFHPWNVSSGSGDVRVFDWTDAAVSHPFVDAVTYVLRTKDVKLRRSLMDTYLDAWSAELSAERLDEVAELALVVGALYQVQTYRTLLPTLLGNGADDGMQDGDLTWIGLSLGCLEHGIGTPAW